MAKTRPAQVKYINNNQEKVKKAKKIWYDANKEHGIKYRKINKEKIKINSRRHALKRRYGMSLESYEILLQSQNGVCAICLEKSKRELCVDHDHKTGRVRGLLCITCNMGLGGAKDKIELLEQMKKYLQKHV